MVRTFDQECEERLRYFEILRSKKMFSKFELEAGHTLSPQNQNNWPDEFLARLGNLLGVTRFEIGDYTGAFHALLRAYSKNKEDVELGNNLITICGEPRKILDLTPLNETVGEICELLAFPRTENRVLKDLLLNILWRAIDEVEDLSELSEAFLKLERVKIKPEIGVFLGVVYRRSGQLKSAIEILSQNPSCEAQNNLGACYIFEGKFSLAEKAFQKALDVNRNFAPAHRQLARVSEDEPTLRLLLEMAEDVIQHGEVEGGVSHLYFAKYEIYQKLGMYREAFSALSEANLQRSGEIKYPRDMEETMLADMEEKTNRLIHTNLFQTEKKPVFIIGMPRSGTTFLERILVKNLDITSMGELNFFNDLAAEFRDFSSTLFSSKWQARLNATLKKNNDIKIHEFYIDKMPHNFRNVGLIRKVFKNAKFILLKRDLLPLKWSNWSTFFESSGLAFSSNMGDINHQLEIYRKYVNLYNLEDSSDVTVVNYEEMISDTEGIVYKISKFLNCRYQDKIETVLEESPVLQLLTFLPGRTYVRTEICYILSTFLI